MIGGAHPEAPQCIKILKCLFYRYRVTLATNLESGTTTYFYGYPPGTSNCGGDKSSPCTRRLVLPTSDSGLIRRYTKTILPGSGTESRSMARPRWVTRRSTTAPAAVVV